MKTITIAKGQPATIESNGSLCFLDLSKDRGIAEHSTALTMHRVVMGQFAEILGVERITLFFDESTETDPDARTAMVEIAIRESVATHGEIARLLENSHLEIYLRRIEVGGNTPSLSKRVHQNLSFFVGERSMITVEKSKGRISSTIIRFPIAKETEGVPMFSGRSLLCLKHGIAIPWA